jgi:hypothetical protein
VAKPEGANVVQDAVTYHLAKPNARAARSAFALRCLAIAVLVLLPAAGRTDPTSSPERYALFVGVSSYESPIDPLLGPKNDVTLLVNTFMSERWVDRSHMRVLADHLEDSFYTQKVRSDGVPTLQGILAGLDWLATRVNRNDEAIIYLSGHGSYLPATDKPGGKTKPDGLDEIFLPIDIKGWDDEKGVTNDLLDHDLGAKIAKIRAKGAFVWLIADSCHSGTLSRAGTRVRSVDPVAKLGVPAALFTGLGPGLPSDERSTSDAVESSNFVGFYATLPSLDEFEELFPRGGNTTELRTHGLLTWYLVRALRTGQIGPFSNMARSIIAGYSEWGTDAPVPMFEGALQREAGLGVAKGRVYAIRVQGKTISVAGGLLDDIDKGSRFDILDLRRDQPTIVGSGIVREALADKSLLSLLIPERIGSISQASAVARLASSISATPSAFGARLSERALMYRLRIAPPSNADSSASSSERNLTTRVQVDLAAVFALPQDEQDTPLELNAGGDLADVRLIVRDGRVWFTPVLRQLVTKGGLQPFSIAGGDVTPTTINKALGIIGRGRNLLRVATLLQDSPLARSLSSRILVEAQHPSADGTCPPHKRDQPVPQGSVVAFDSSSNRLADAVIQNCDNVFIVLTNKGAKTIDITPFYIDHWLRIGFLADYFEATYGGLRLRPGQSQAISYTEHTSQAAGVSPSGQGHIVLLGTEADESAPIASDYRYLATDRSDAVRGDQYSPGSLAALLSSAAVGSGAFRSAPRVDASQAAAVVLNFVTRDALSY